MALLETVIVADDEELGRQAVAELLGDEGYQVHEAGDGQTVLDILEEYEIDLILCDIKMPGMDGMAALKQVGERSPRRW